jgi:hypothetical protein
VIKFVMKRRAVRRIARIASAAVVGVCLAAPAAHASAVLSYTECIASVYLDSDSSVVAGQTVSSSATNCFASASSDFGVLKAYASSTDGNTSAKGTASWSIDFMLMDPTLGANTPTTIFVPIDYDYALSANSGASFARFGMTQDYITYYASYSSSGSPFGGNTCPSPVGVPGCNGLYEGTVLIPVPALVNTTGPNRFFLTIAAEAAAGVTDAFNTITIGNVILPDSMIFSYPDLPGNPMNFGRQPSVPEPATATLVLGGALIAAFGRRRRSLE